MVQFRSNRSPGCWRSDLVRVASQRYVQRGSPAVLDWYTCVRNPVLYYCNGLTLPHGPRLLMKITHAIADKVNITAIVSTRAFLYNGQLFCRITIPPSGKDGLSWTCDTGTILAMRLSDHTITVFAGTEDVTPVEVTVNWKYACL